MRRLFCFCSCDSATFANWNTFARLCSVMLSAVSEIDSSAFTPSPSRRWVSPSNPSFLEFSTVLLQYRSCEGCCCWSWVALHHVDVLHSDVKRAFGRPPAAFPPICTSHWLKRSNDCRSGRSKIYWMQIKACVVYTPWFYVPHGNSLPASLLSWPQAPQSLPFGIFWAHGKRKP